MSFSMDQTFYMMADGFCSLCIFQVKNSDLSRHLVNPIFKILAIIVRNGVGKLVSSKDSMDDKFVLTNQIKTITENAVDFKLLASALDSLHSHFTCNLPPRMRLI